MSSKATPKIALPTRIQIGEEVILKGSEISPSRVEDYIALTLYGRPRDSVLAPIERVDDTTIKFTVPVVPSANNTYRVLTENALGDRVFLGVVHVDP